MKVLVDHHHGALLRSLYYLFKKRFNFELYVPTGFDWLDKDKLYSAYPNRDTADQMLNSWIHDIKYKEMFMPMTHEQFLNTEIDIIVASLWENHAIFKNIVEKYNLKSKLILQAGNNITSEMVDSTQTKNLLSSAYPTYVTSNVHKVFYRQEFNQSIFKSSENYNIKSVANYKHIMEDEFKVILALEKKLPDWEFKCYGAGNRDGCINDIESEMAESINKFGFVFHVKKDDGYGHVIHNSFACGKPMIVNLSTAGVYRNGTFIRNTASFLYEKDKTIIDVNDGVDIIADKLKLFADNYPIYRENVITKYKEVVDFDKEFQDVKKFIENLV